MEGLDPQALADVVSGNLPELALATAAIEGIRRGSKKYGEITDSTPPKELTELRERHLV